MKSRTRYLLAAALWLVTIGLSLLIVANSVHYYLQPAAEIPFFTERPTVTNSPLWRSMFHYHVTGAIVCLLTGPFLLSTWLLRRSVAAHRVVGWAYVACVLVVSAPSGAYLALFAKGGVLGQIGFLVLAVAWFQSTLAGLLAIRAGDLLRHRRWMTWSYAWVTSAISFRLLYVGLSFVSNNDPAIYVWALWLSGAVSAAVALSLQPALPAPATSGSMAKPAPGSAYLEKGLV
ncbi:MAG: DUF2306 domain-containing protein [Planctomycetota bacterium]